MQEVDDVWKFFLLEMLGEVQLSETMLLVDQESRETHGIPAKEYD